MVLPEAFVLTLACPHASTAYPDGHTDAESSGADIRHLKEKVDAGADFIITQLFYDVDGFLEWQKKVRDIGAHGFLISCSVHGAEVERVVCGMTVRDV